MRVVLSAALVAASHGVAGRGSALLQLKRDVDVDFVAATLSAAQDTPASTAAPSVDWSAAPTKDELKQAEESSKQADHDLDSILTGLDTAPHNPEPEATPQAPAAEEPADAVPAAAEAAPASDEAAPAPTEAAEEAPDTSGAATPDAAPEAPTPEAPAVDATPAQDTPAVDADAAVDAVAPAPADAAEGEQAPAPEAAATPAPGELSDAALDAAVAGATQEQAAVEEPVGDSAAVLDASSTDTSADPSTQASVPASVGLSENDVSGILQGTSELGTLVHPTATASADLEDADQPAPEAPAPETDPALAKEKQDDDADLMKDMDGEMVTSGLESRAAVEPITQSLADFDSEVEKDIETAGRHAAHPQVAQAPAKEQPAQNLRILVGKPHMISNLQKGSSAGQNGHVAAVAKATPVAAPKKHAAPLAPVSKAAEAPAPKKVAAVVAEKKAPAHSVVPAVNKKSAAPVTMVQAGYMLRGSRRNEDQDDDRVSGGSSTVELSGGLDVVADTGRQSGQSHHPRDQEESRDEPRRQEDEDSRDQDEEEEDSD
mmetsp:Transcript_63961/g.147308  ORF Transcript_63961/g.147308 Transcript_63961/m.147308 type:complete len:546 (+) Transcript_63961:181-1818(+)